MLKLIVFCTLLCAFLREIYAEEDANAVRELQLSQFHAYTLVNSSHLITIANNFTHLFINSTDVNLKACTVDVGDHIIQTKTRATVIGQKIIVWGIRTEYKTKLGKMIDHTVLIVDPWQCDFKAVSTFEEARLFHFYENVPQVVAYNDSFDVFYPSLNTCAPCRFSIDGKSIDLKYQLELENYERFQFSLIRSFSAPGVEKGYVFAYTFGSRFSAIKLLDANFRIIKQKYLDHVVNALAVNLGDNPTINVCYITGDLYYRATYDTLDCKRFDANLGELFTTQLPMLKEHGIDDVSLAVNSSAEVYVSVAEHLDDIEKFRYYRLSSNGTVIDAATVGQLSGSASYRRWAVRSFFVGNQYCIEYTKDLASYEIKTFHDAFIKCTVPKL